MAWHSNKCLENYLALIGLLVAFSSLGPLASQARSENWPQWRGPSGTGISGESNLPSKWSATENIAWSMDMPGSSGATPVVWGDRIFVSSSEGKSLVMMCISTDGKLLWKKAVGAGNRQARGDGNMASPTPSTDGKHVWVFYGTGVLVCFDVDGKQVWKTDMQKRYGQFKMGFGMHSTPVLHGDQLYFQLIHSGGAWVIALDKATGKETWKVERKSDGVAECEHSYASAVMWQKGDQAYLITHGNDYAIGHQLKDGKEIWRVGGLNPKNSYNKTLRFVTTPVATADLIIIPSAKNHGVVGLRPDAKGFVTTGNQYENWRINKGTPDVPSPVVRDGLVYLCRENGVLMCLDAKTGKEYYAEPTVRSRFRASLVYGDGKIYCTAGNGSVAVVKAGKKFKLLSTNKLDDTLMASPAISNGRIYLRGWKKLYAVQAK
jgi:outer membrane protein assembly factor BamB